MQDVCGSNHTVEAGYGTWGYRLIKVPKPAVTSEGSSSEYGNGAAGAEFLLDLGVSTGVAPSLGRVSSRALMRAHPMNWPALLLVTQLLVAGAAG